MTSCSRDTATLPRERPAAILSAVPRPAARARVPRPVNTVLIESVCFHPDNAGVVRVLGTAVAIVGLAGLGWILRELAAGGGIGGRRIGLAAVWLAASVALFLLVTRTGVRLTIDPEHKTLRQEARIAGVPQIREFPFSAFQHVTVTFDYAEWETWGSTRSAGQGRSTKHVSPVKVFTVAIAGAEDIRVDTFHVARAAERRAVELARLMELAPERRGYRVGAMTADELRGFRVVRSQTVGPGEEMAGTDGLRVGTVRIRAGRGESQPLSLDDWPRDETRTVPVIVPRAG